MPKSLNEVLTEASNVEDINTYEVETDEHDTTEETQSAATEDSQSDITDNEKDSGSAGDDSTDTGLAAGDAGETKDSEGGSSGQLDGKDIHDGDESDDLRLDDLPDVKEETRARFDKLLNSRKEFKQQNAELQAALDELTPIREQYEGLTGRLQQAQMDEQDMDFMLTVNSLLKSPNMQDRMRAADMIGNLNEVVQRQIGRPTQNYDPLSEFPDLQDRVNKYQISEADAREMAVARKQQNLHETNNQQLELANRQQMETRQMVTAAQNEILGLETQWKGADPDYAVKEPHVVAAMKDIMENVHPSRWKNALDSEYNRISQLVVAQAQQNTGRPASRQPNAMRPSGSSGKGAAPEPKSMLDALSQGLAEMRSGSA